MWFSVSHLKCQYAKLLEVTNTFDSKCRKARFCSWAKRGRNRTDYESVSEAARRASGAMCKCSRKKNMRVPVSYVEQIEREWIPFSISLPGEPNMLTKTTGGGGEEKKEKKERKSSNKWKQANKRDGRAISLFAWVRTLCTSKSERPWKFATGVTRTDFQEDFHMVLVQNVKGWKLSWNLIDEAHLVVALNRLLACHYRGFVSFGGVLSR